MSLPFNKPYTGTEEEQALSEALRKGHLRGDGPYTKRVQEQMEEWLGVKHVLLTTSCTHALEMAVIVLGIGPGDEVIMPAFNFVSSANAVVLRGATPVFADIKPETMNIDPADIERKITNHTKAIIPVHYAGVSCDMDAIMNIAKKHNLFVIEDAAQGVDAFYEDKPLGSIGHIGCYSFHDTKNITCGEGGAFLTNDDEIAQKAEVIREKGTNRAAFMRGEIDKYTWVWEGSSYIPSDLLAAMLEAQLKKKDGIKQKRKELWELYRETLADCEKSGKIILPEIPAGRSSNYHIFYFFSRTKEEQDLLLTQFKKAEIPAAFHYVPLHSAPFAKEFLNTTNLPKTDEYSNRLIRLPLYPDLELTETFLQKIVDVIHSTISNR
ncbi:dTDP-4-amino-4,6-dideoxygalactose transaminase [Rhodohalobacter sp. 614A]|uniref:dTDP-4-amino-4,6-dideoxygalactose transaminase n=1 Tax=Rhodohalobacter sp. 614A TaxID=2908649 RepID=UPI001F160415|nr:dTDP-4-amino-4,6-dideoxygalactose transaminase [Rhodohalobacter sp. 614A]